MTERVLRCLAYGHPRGVAEVVERLRRAQVVVEADVVEEALVELLEAGRVEQVGAGWRRA